jgi:hypothetical protein
VSSAELHGVFFGVHPPAAGVPSGKAPTTQTTVPLLHHLAKEVVLSVVSVVQGGEERKELRRLELIL